MTDFQLERWATGSEVDEAPPDNVKSATLTPLGIYSQRVICVKIGQEEVAPRFRFHRALAMHHSGWFRSKFAGHTPADHDRHDHMFVLDGVNQDAFIIFLEWMYKQTLTPIIEWETVYNITSNKYFDDDVTATYIFAHEYSVPALKTLLLKLSVDWFKDFAPRHTAIIKAFTRLPGNSPFLQLLVDATCFNGDPEDYEPGSDFEPDPNGDKSVALPSCFLIRVAKKYADLTKNTGKKMELRHSDYCTGTDTAVDDAVDGAVDEQLTKRRKTAR
ncbi:hypothetical protein SLS60_000461 [Paraconiothyrium brasiliense]|uniref:BTB domain-containing protein n=1 Tax=Paraconiothyrium brasiliense TaxID=300254 RepID=A0ABR3S7S1_9PLEO